MAKSNAARSSKSQTRNYKRVTSKEDDRLLTSVREHRELELLAVVGKAAARRRRREPRRVYRERQARVAERVRKLKAVQR